MPSAGNDHDTTDRDTTDRDINGGQQDDMVPLRSEVGAEAEVSPQNVAMTFVGAVAWGEHIRIWELLSDEARRVVLRVAVNRGMDEGLAARLRDGTAAHREREDFLTDLVNGLRADLRGNDLDALEFQPDPDSKQPDPSRARVMLMAPMVSPALGAALPVASIELVRDGGRWRVEHLLPRARA